MYNILVNIIYATPNTVNQESFVFQQLSKDVHRTVRQVYVGKRRQDRLATALQTLSRWHCWYSLWGSGVTFQM